MRKLFFVAAIAMFAITSCKKSSSGGGSTVGTITMTINGSATSFNNSAVASSSNSGGTYIVSIAGFSGTPGASSEFVMTISESSPITAKTYVEGTDMASFGFYDFSSSTSYTWDGTSPNPPTIVITSITSSNVQGTFSGDIWNGSTKKTVASGTFNLNF